VGSSGNQTAETEWEVDNWGDDITVDIERFML